MRFMRNSERIQSIAGIAGLRLEFRIVVRKDAPKYRFILVIHECYKE